MDIKTESFGTLTQVVFDKSLKYLKSVGSRLALEFDNTIKFAVAAVFHTGDATHINKVLPVLVLAKLEPMFRRVVVAFEIIPFNYDRKECQYTGKISVGRRAALELVVNGVPQWETLLIAALQGELPENKTTPAFNLENRSDSFFKAARKAGHTDIEINKALAASRRKHPVDSTMLTPKDQKVVKAARKTQDVAEVAKAA
jgi:hypothetical protein